MSTDPADVEDVLVSVAFARSDDGAPEEVFLLGLRRSPAAAARSWDERAYLDALDPVLQAEPDRPRSVTLTRRWTTWRPGGGQAEVAVRLGLADTDPAASPGTGSAVLAAFGALLARERAGEPQPADREAAVAAARRAARRVHEDAHPELTDEEHRPADGSWRLGLATADGTQLLVTVGVLAGDPRTVHVRRRAAAEVVDSVGV